VGNSLDYASFFICIDLLQAFFLFSHHFLFFVSTPLLQEHTECIHFLYLANGAHRNSLRAANGVHRNSLTKAGIVSGMYFLSSFKYCGEKQT